MNQTPSTPSVYRGSCHCGRVTFEATIDLSKGGTRCNCSICTKLSPLGAMVKPPEFKLLTGQEDLSTYTWGHAVSQRFFCKHCGTYCYGQGHLAELGGDFVSVNLNCLDGVELTTLPVVYWDGRRDNWHAGTRSTPWPILAPEQAS